MAVDDDDVMAFFFLFHCIKRFFCYIRRAKSERHDSRKTIWNGKQTKSKKPHINSQMRIRIGISRGNIAVRAKASEILFGVFGVSSIINETCLPHFIVQV